MDRLLLQLSILTDTKRWGAWLSKVSIALRHLSEHCVQKNGPDHGGFFKHLIFIFSYLYMVVGWSTGTCMFRSLQRPEDSAEALGVGVYNSGKPPPYMDDGNQTRVLWSNKLHMFLTLTTEKSLLQPRVDVYIESMYFFKTRS